MTFLKALIHFILVGFFLLTFIYLSFFGLIARKADLLKNKECEIEIFAGATVPLDADIPTESCSEKVWRNSIFWAIFVFVLTCCVWIPFVSFGAFIWQKAYARHFQQRRLVAIIFIFLASLIPSMITAVILFYEFSFEQI